MSIDWVLRHSRDCPQSSVLPGCLDENRGCMSVGIVYSPWYSRDAWTRGVYECRPGPKTFPGFREEVDNLIVDRLKVFVKTI